MNVSVLKTVYLHTPTDREVISDGRVSPGAAGHTENQIVTFLSFPESYSS